MSYSIDVSFAPANELAVSLNAYTCKSGHKRLELGADWAKQTKSSLTPAFREELDKLKPDDAFHLVFLLIRQCPDAETPESFLRWLERVTAGEMYERLSPWVSTFTEDLGSTRDRMVHLLSEWNAQYFHSFDKAMLARMKQEAERRQAQIEAADPALFAEELTNGLRFQPLPGFKKLFLFPQHHNLPAPYVKHFGGSTVCGYAFDASPADPEEPSLHLHRLTRCLSDKSRLRILRFFKDEPRTFIDAVRHIGLAKSTVHDHIALLRDTGLLRTFVTGDCAQTYEVRPEAFDQLRVMLGDYLER